MGTAKRGRFRPKGTGARVGQNSFMSTLNKVAKKKMFDFVFFEGQFNKSYFLFFLFGGLHILRYTSSIADWLEYFGWLTPFEEVSRSFLADSVSIYSILLLAENALCKPTLTNYAVYIYSIYLYIKINIQRFTRQGCRPIWSMYS